jgi:hypothetical protein
MAVRFSRSLRSLDADRGIASYIVLACAALLVVAWLMWFFFAPITQYETSSTFTIRRDGVLLVQFDESALTRIRPGQTAIMIPTVTTDGFAAPMEAEVLATPDSTNRRDGVVQVYLSMNGMPPADLTGEVRIRVEAVSPFTLILRSQS